MSCRRGITSRLCLAAIAGLLAMAPSLAQEDGGGLDADYLTPAERAALELKRRREAQSVLACSPTVLRATLTQGETQSLKLTVLNAGGLTLDWKAKLDTGMLSADVTEGSLGFEQERLVSVTVKSEGLEAGTVQGRILLEAPGAKGSPLEVPVVVTVRPKAQPEPPARRRETPTISEMPRVGSNGAKKFGIGVRAGYLSMGSPDRGDSGAAPLVGVSLGKRGPARMSWEAGVDFAAPEAGDGTFTSTVVAGRFDLLFSLGANPGGNGKRARPYLLSGAEALIESAEEGGESYTNYIGGLNLGVGARFGSSFDLRATYTVVVDSSNSVGLVLLTAGMSF